MALVMLPQVVACARRTSLETFATARGVQAIVRTMGCAFQESAYVVLNFMASPVNWNVVLVIVQGMVIVSKGVASVRATSVVMRAYYRYTRPKLCVCSFPEEETTRERFQHSALMSSTMRSVSNVQGVAATVEIASKGSACVLLAGRDLTAQSLVLAAAMAR
mmetsp:Transcript_33108/g.51464  ORF Transcript_33108/g.51464 Transcript_33108/m.51464 type:complete len:162 (+) Transcript_33108:813-1298(+)